MALTRLVHQVHKAGFGDRTSWAGGILTVARDEAR
ncbi:MAG: hypothetical protein QOK39_248, partial [Acidimicrobiaceae bacterium]|nr:hypothetical protein [Acidimicrobiaceae bacterium]